VNKGIVICTWYGGQETLGVLLKSLEGYTDYPIYVVINGYGKADKEWVNSIIRQVGGFRIIGNAQDGYELGAIKLALEFTNLDEFVLLQDTIEIINTDLFRILLEDYLDVSVSYGPYFHSYLGKFRREALNKIDIPCVSDKIEAVRNEADFTNLYRDIERVEVFNPSFTDTIGTFEEMFGRTNLVLKDSYIIKRKGTWNSSQLYSNEEEHIASDLAHLQK